MCLSPINQPPGHNCVRVWILTLNSLDLPGTLFYSIGIPMWLCDCCLTNSCETAKPLVLGSYAEDPVYIHGQNNQTANVGIKEKFSVQCVAFVSQRRCNVCTCFVIIGFTAGTSSDTFNRWSHHWCHVTDRVFSLAVTFFIIIIITGSTSTVLIVFPTTLALVALHGIGEQEYENSSGVFCTELLGVLTVLYPQNKNLEALRHVQAHWNYGRYVLAVHPTA